MKEKETEMLRNRAELFSKRFRYLILGDHILMDAKFAKTSEILKFPEQNNLKYKPIKEGDKWGIE